MYVLIAIIFIAELIIAGFIIYWIVRADKAVKNLDKKCAEFGTELISAVPNVRGSVGTVQTAAEKAVAFIERKRSEFLQRVINFVLIYLVLFFLKFKFKKAAVVCEYAVLLKDFWDSIPG